MLRKRSPRILTFELFSQALYLPGGLGDMCQPGNVTVDDCRRYLFCFSVLSLIFSSDSGFLSSRLVGSLPYVVYLSRVVVSDESDIRSLLSVRFPTCCDLPTGAPALISPHAPVLCGCTYRSSPRIASATSKRSATCAPDLERLRTQSHGSVTSLQSVRAIGKATSGSTNMAPTLS